MSDADYGFYVDQGLVLCLSVVLLTLSIMLLWRERKTTSQRVTKLGYVIRRLVAVVLVLIGVRYVEPSGILASFWLPICALLSLHLHFVFSVLTLISVPQSMLDCM